MTTLKEIMRKLPKERRKKIAKRTAELIAQEMTIRELRKARQITQEQLAKALGIKQEQISRTEKRSDMHVSTLQKNIEAMGGKLTLIAEFPTGEKVRLSGFGEAA